MLTLILIFHNLVCRGIIIGSSSILLITIEKWSDHNENLPNSRFSPLKKEALLPVDK